ncbi:MAG: hypothetical protein NTV22_13510 [bacterium]|nr:hypothetical protein [bacterium]
MTTDAFPPPVSADLATINAAQRVRIPAIIQIVLWSASALSSVYSLISAMSGVNTEQIMATIRKATENNPDAAQMMQVTEQVIGIYGTYALPTAVVSVVVVLVGLIGSIRMLQMKTYGLAMVAAILTLIPCVGPCCCLGLPIGIWSLVVLSNAHVRQQFT